MYGFSIPLLEQGEGREGSDTVRIIKNENLITLNKLHCLFVGGIYSKGAVVIGAG